jgi:hypothetical protein
VAFVAQDTFSDSNGTLLQNHTSDSGHDWIKRDHTSIDDDFEIQGNECRWNASAAKFVDGYHLDLEPSGDEYEVEVRAKHSHNSGNNDRFQLNVRFDPDPAPRTYYRMEWRSNNNSFSISRNVAGTGATLASTTLTGFDVGTYYKLKFYTKIDENGDVVLEGYVDDGLILSVVDDSVDKLTWRGRVGFSAGSSGNDRTVTWDDFELRVLVVAQALVGTSSNAGSLATNIITYVLQSLFDTSSNSGVLATFVNKIQALAGAATNAGALAKKALKAIAGTSADTGELAADDLFSARWSLEHLEARLDYGFPAVYVEVNDSAIPSGAFPEGVFFERRILEVPRLEEVELDSRFGISGFQRTTLILDNSDSFFNAKDMQGMYIRMCFVDDAGTICRVFNGQVVDWTLSHRCTLNLEDVDAIAITQDLPRRTVNTLIEAEKAADANFENVVIANDLGNPMPVIFGRAVKVPLLYVKADGANREYDYVIGEGKGLNGNNFQDVFTVYRNDQALDEINGNAQSGSSASALKLESGDQRPDSWYKYWWVKITSGPGAGDIRHVAAYNSATNIITPNSNFSAALTTSSVYKLTEWRFYDGSQASPYNGFAFIRFKKRMGVSGSTDPIYADVNGFGDETNVVRAVQSLLSNPDWGLGLDVDTVSFDAAAGISAVSTMLCEGAITETAAAVDVLNELLGFRDMVLSKYVEIRISVDQAKTPAHNFGLGDETRWNNILIASPVVLHIHPNEKVKNLKVRYRKNFGEGDVYQYELERQSSLNGVDRTLNLPFVYDHSTADRWLDYKRKRFAAAVKRMSLEVGQDGRDAARGELVAVSVPSLGMNAQEWEVTGSGVTPAGANSLSLVPYSATPYTYVPVTSEGGTLPVDELFDIPPDYTQSIPDPVSGVSVTMSMGIVGFTAHPFALITWTPPEDNYGGAVVSVKLHSEATTLFRAVGTYTTSARIEGLIPGQLYDFLIESLNVTGEFKGIGVTVNNSGAGYIAGGDSTAPGTWTHNLDGEAKHGILSWWWDKHPASDVSHYEYEIYSATSGGSILPGGKGIVPHSGKSNTQPRVEYKRQSGNLTSSLVGALRVRAIDHSGNPNDETSGWTARFGLSTGAVVRDDIGNGAVDENKRVVVYSHTETGTMLPLAPGQGSRSFRTFAHGLSKIPLTTLNLTLTSYPAALVHSANVTQLDATNMGVVVNLFNAGTTSFPSGIDWTLIIKYW